jgi:hypothetical protein
VFDHHIVSPRRGSDDSGPDALAAGRSSKHGEADGQRGSGQRLLACPGPSGGVRGVRRRRHAALLLAQLPAKTCVRRCQMSHRHLLSMYRELGFMVLPRPNAKEYLLICVNYS